MPKTWTQLISETNVQILLGPPISIIGYSKGLCYYHVCKGVRVVCNDALIPLVYGDPPAKSAKFRHLWRGGWQKSKRFLYQPLSLCLRVSVSLRLSLSLSVSLCLSLSLRMW